MLCLSPIEKKFLNPLISVLTSILVASLQIVYSKQFVGVSDLLVT